MQGYIDLSKRRVSPEDIIKCEERYMKSKTVASIIRHVASKVPSVGVEGQEEAKTAEQEEKEHEAKRNRRVHRKEAQERGEEVVEDEGATASASEEERCEQLYDQIAWPLGKIYGHPYDAFKLALTCVSITAIARYRTFTYLSQQRGRHRLRPAADPHSSSHSYYLNVHHCPQVDASANQASCGYRIDMLHSSWHRCYQEGVACR